MGGEGRRGQGRFASVSGGGHCKNPRSVSSPKSEKFEFLLLQSVLSGGEGHGRLTTGEGGPFVEMKNFELNLIAT